MMSACGRAASRIHWRENYLATNRRLFESVHYRILSSFRYCKPVMFQLSCRPALRIHAGLRGRGGEETAQPRLGETEDVGYREPVRAIAIYAGGDRGDGRWCNHCGGGQMVFVCVCVARWWLGADQGEIALKGLPISQWGYPPAPTLIIDV